MTDESIDIESIFNVARGKEGPEEQAAYLDEACRGRPEVRKRIEQLLKAEKAAGDFLNKPAKGPTVDIPSKLEVPGTVIDRYKLLQQIGEGGFGVVYMAEQEEPIRRRVALKIIKLGMDTKQVIARFEAERQALAMMDHPNIAHVFDAGSTDTGRPYFVMELVKGVPITEYCDSNNLSTDERLTLFMDVCMAVQHAHQKGIIHRDIKPSNVMITLHDGVPVPKVIDFGVAKATQHRLTEKTLFTEFRQFIGTPEYMSPEQAEMSGLDVDTRSDIYSLGVLLYELLTGTTPFDAKELRSAAFDEVLRIIRETEPPKPSTRLNTLGETLTDIAKHRHVEPGQLCRIVRGDLDWIVMKTLEKDRTRRYETSHELAMDIQRYMNDEPVTAGPPSRVYRIKKFIRRNRTAVTSVLLIALALVIGLSLATVGFVRASLERDRAVVAEADAVRQHDLAQEQRQRAEIGFQVFFAAVEEMLKVAGVSVGLVDRKWQIDIKWLADNPDVQELLYGLLKEAQLLYKEFSEKNMLDPAARVETARSFDRLGEIQKLLSQYDEAEQTYHRVINFYEELIQEFPDERDYQYELGYCLRNLGTLLKDTNRVKEAEQVYQKAVIVWSKFIEMYPDSIPCRHRLSECYLELGEWEKALAEYTKLLELEPNNFWLLHMCGVCYLNLDKPEEAVAEYTKLLELEPETVHYWHMRGTCHVELGKHEKAIADYTKAIELNPNDAHFWHIRGASYLELGRPEKAVNEYTKAIELNPDNIHYWNMLKRCCLKLGEPEKVIAEYTKAISPVNTPQKMFKLGQMLKETGQAEKAEELYQKALEAQQKLTADSPEVAKFWAALGQLNLELKKWDKMAANYSKAIEIEPQNSWYWHERGYANMWLKKWEEAIRDYSRVVSLDPKNLQGWQRRANVYAYLKQWDKAKQDLTKAIELLEETDSPALLVDALSKLGITLRRTGQLRESDETFRRAITILEGMESELTDVPKQQSAFASSANSLAWRFVRSPDITTQDAARAVELTKKAVQAAPQVSMYWNTLGVAQYRAGNWEDTITTLNKSRELGKGAHDGSDLLFIAMAQFQLGRMDEALQNYEKAVKWMEQRTVNEELRRFCAEAAELLGISEKPAEKEEQPEEKENK